ncbi:MAG: hypothetical protein MJ237_05720 [bacterium]|nr:hypothetical protein [bacterium]
MVGKRNKFIELVKFVESNGLTLNIAKNKALGHKGFFKAKNGDLRIDIAKGLDEDAIVRTIIHEFIHYVHYSYDKTLSSLDFIFKGYESYNEEDLLKLTVETIPKSSVSPLFEMKNNLHNSINVYYSELHSVYPDFKLSKPYCKLEKSLRHTDLRYLLSYDKVAVYKGFEKVFYSIKDLDNDFQNIGNDIKTYIKLKSAQRALKRVNNRISRLNKYYNSPTELLARSMELYYTSPHIVKEMTPDLYKIYEDVMNTNKIPLLTSLLRVMEFFE